MGQIQQSVNNAMLSMAIAKTYAQKSKKAKETAESEVGSLQELYKESARKKIEHFRDVGLARASQAEDIDKGLPKSGGVKESIQEAKDKQTPIDPNVYGVNSGLPKSGGVKEKLGGM